jgi:hypothetical protein
MDEESYVDDDDDDDDDVVLVLVLVLEEREEAWDTRAASAAAFSAASRSASMAGSFPYKTRASSVNAPSPIETKKLMPYRKLGTASLGNSPANHSGWVRSWTRAASFRTPMISLSSWKRNLTKIRPPGVVSCSVMRMVEHTA